MSDFNGDGKPDVAAVVTPHIGVKLTPHHYRAPHVPCAKAMDTSNHLVGSPEQQLAVILQLPSQRPTIIVPDMSLKALHARRSEGIGATAKFKELADVMPLPARVQRHRCATRHTRCRLHFAGQQHLATCGVERRTLTRQTVLLLLFA